MISLLLTRVEALRACAARVAAYWHHAADLDAALRSMWTSDALRALEALDRLQPRVVREGSEVALDEAERAYIQGTVACISSELRDRVDEEAHILLDEWTRSSDTLLADLRRLVEAHAQRDPARQLSVMHPTLVSQVQVMRTGDRQYDLYCAICGQRAVTFSVEPGGLGALPGTASQLALICQGIIWRHTFSVDLAPPVFTLLGKDDVKGAHGLIIERGANAEGIDAWCPECERVYCKLHYVCVDEYDEGFYDVTRGTCPQGHTRRVAD